MVLARQFEIGAQCNPPQWIGLPDDAGRGFYPYAVADDPAVAFGNLCEQPLAVDLDHFDDVDAIYVLQFRGGRLQTLVAGRAVLLAAGQRNARWNPPIDFSIRSSGMVSDKRI